jgi:hypothetical protein
LAGAAREVALVNQDCTVAARAQLVVQTRSIYPASDYRDVKDGARDGIDFFPSLSQRGRFGSLTWLRRRDDFLIELHVYLR